MQFDILTLFPEMFYGILNASMLKRAQEKGLLRVNLINIRDFSKDRHRCVDDYPFGGGPGMVLSAEPIVAAVEHVLGQTVGALGLSLPEKTGLMLLSPQGKPFTQEQAFTLSHLSRIVLICGHYAGMDERVRSLLKPVEISIGDYILTGGELPALVVLDAVTRLIPGVLGARKGEDEESFYNGLLEAPQYTRPRVFRGLSVPEVLLSGDHARIKEWKKKQALLRTWERRKDLLKQRDLSPTDQLRLDEALRK